MAARIDFDTLPSPILLQGDEHTAYRDPAAVYHDGVFHLFYTLVLNPPDLGPRLHVATSQSVDLKNWTSPRILTPTDPKLNFSSPGNIVRFDDKWVMCLQTYPRPGGIKYADPSARLWVMTSDDLATWTEPQLMRVKGPDVPREQMGRMIDPFLFPDRRERGKWWCSYKQDGVSLSASFDLRQWEYVGRIEGGENSCVLVEADQYILFHSPENGIGVKRSDDLVRWHDRGTLYLGQDEWPWAQGRLTAGFVLDLRDEPGVGRYIMFFHGSGPEDESIKFDTHASIGVAWSSDLIDWHWPR